MTVEVSRYAVNPGIGWIPPRSPTTVGMAVDTTVISIAAIDRLSRAGITVGRRLVLIAR